MVRKEEHMPERGWGFAFPLFSDSSRSTLVFYLFFIIDVYDKKLALFQG
jgi:hypothetical protein